MIANWGTLSGSTSTETWGGNSLSANDSTTASNNSTASVSLPLYIRLSSMNYEDTIQNRAWEAYQKWLRSRAWATAPRVIKPVVTILGKRFLWNRFINHDWTGRNYKKF